MSATRSQDEYNKIIQEVDIFVMLFWTKVGKYTHEEFTLAKKLFLETGKPRVLVYQKMANPENQEQSLKDFITSLLENNKEYFWGNYEHFDTLALKFDKELKKYVLQNKIEEGFQKLNSQNNLSGLVDEIISKANQQRVEDLGKRLTQSQTLLKRFEEELEFETNPRVQMRYERDIKNTQTSIEKVLAEIESLK